MDLGCGEGQFYDIIRKYRRNIEYTRVDISETQIKKLKSKGYKGFVVDATKEIPFKKNSFDVVVCFEIIEHIFDTDYFLKEIYKVLKEKGKLILITPNIANYMDRIRLLFGRLPSCLEYRVNETTRGI